MKKILSAALTLLFTMTIITGCSTGTNDTAASESTPPQTSTEQSDSNNTSDDGSQETVSDTEPSEEVSKDTTASSKTLIVYYTATGTTGRIAEVIADYENADIFVIEPVEPYTADDLDWTNSDSRVCREHDTPDTRHTELVTTTVDNFDSYDVVYIGYPIWWQKAAWVVDDFVKNNDFSGKTVIPFCTSVSSPLGESGTALAEMAGNGNWLEGVRFSGGASDDEVKKWIDSLNLH